MGLIERVRRVGGVALHRIESDASGPGRAGIAAAVDGAPPQAREIPLTRCPSSLSPGRGKRGRGVEVRGFVQTLEARPRPFARAPIPDGRSTYRNSSKGWNATPAAPSSLRKAVARTKLPPTHSNQLSIFSGNVPSVPGFHASPMAVRRLRSS